MFRRFVRETGRLCRTKQTWLLIAVMVFSPIFTATDFFGLGSRVYDTTISNVLMLNPARLSLYIGAFSIMVFTLLQLRKLYSGGTYIIVESAVNPVAQILLQTLAICVILVASVCAALLVLCPYTAIVMKELFSFAKFIRTWVYVYLLGLLITVLLTSGVFLIFRNFEVSLILMSALMLFSISRPTESYYLTHWLQTSVTSILDGTESTLWFRIILFTRFIGLLVGIGAYALGLLCVRRYSKGMFGSIIRNVRHAAIPLMLAAAIITSVFYVNHDPFCEQEDTLAGATYKIDEDTNKAEIDDAELTEQIKSQSELYNYEIKWKEMRKDTTFESDHLQGKATYLVENRSKGKVAQELTVKLFFGIEPTQILCNGESLDFYKINYTFILNNYYRFTLPAGLETVNLEIQCAGYFKTPTNSSTEVLSFFSISEQYIQLTDDTNIYLMIPGTEGAEVVETISLPENLTLMVTETDNLAEIAPAMEGYRTYQYSTIFGERIDFHYIYAGDYLTETTQVGDLKIQFLYFRNKEKIIKEIGAMDIIKDAVAYFTGLYGPLNFDGAPLIVAEIGRDSSWQSGTSANISYFPESALVSSFYRADRENPDATRNAGLKIIVQAIAEQWWNYAGGASVLEWQFAFRNYSTYLYIKHLYGEAYADETLKDPWYKAAKYQQNEFYRCNKQYISILPVKDAIAVSLRYQNLLSMLGSADIDVTALFHAEELLGGEDALVQKLVEVFKEWNPRNYLVNGTIPSLDYETFIAKLGLTKEEFEAW